jgi:hypothetical protein
MEEIHDIWTIEDLFIDDFVAAKNNTADNEYHSMLNRVRSIHFTLKPTEDGTAELPFLPPPELIGKNDT